MCLLRIITNHAHPPSLQYRVFIMKDIHPPYPSTERLHVFILNPPPLNIKALPTPTRALRVWIVKCKLSRQLRLFKVHSRADHVH